MMCNDKQRNNCNVEKIGCEGCFYYQPEYEILYRCQTCHKDKCDNCTINKNEIEKINNYITNLEKEIIRLTEIEEHHRKLNGELRIQIKQLKLN